MHINDLMHIGNFLVVGNGHACDSNHPRMLFVPVERMLGKCLSWVDLSLSLVPRRDECVRYDMMGYDEW